MDQINNRFICHIYFIYLNTCMQSVTQTYRHMLKTLLLYEQTSGFWMISYYIQCFRPGLGKAIVFFNTDSVEQKLLTQ